MLHVFIFTRPMSLPRGEDVYKVAILDCVGNCHTKSELHRAKLLVGKDDEDLRLSKVVIVDGLVAVEDMSCIFIKRE